MRVPDRLDTNPVRAFCNVAQVSKHIAIANRTLTDFITCMIFEDRHALIIGDTLDLKVLKRLRESGLKYGCDGQGGKGNKSAAQHGGSSQDTSPKALRRSIRAVKNDRPILIATAINFMTSAHKDRQGPKFRVFARKLNLADYPRSRRMLQSHLKAL